MGNSWRPFAFAAFKLIRLSNATFPPTNRRPEREDQVRGADRRARGLAQVGQGGPRRRRSGGGGLPVPAGGKGEGDPRDGTEPLFLELERTRTELNRTELSSFSKNIADFCLFSLIFFRISSQFFFEKIKGEKNLPSFGNLWLANLGTNFELLRTSKTRLKNSSFRTRTSSVPSLLNPLLSLIKIPFIHLRPLRRWPPASYTLATTWSSLSLARRGRSLAGWPS